MMIIPRTTAPDPLDVYREEDMFLEDLECCEPEFCDCWDRRRRRAESVGKSTPVGAPTGGTSCGGLREALSDPGSFPAASERKPAGGSSRPSGLPSNPRWLDLPGEAAVLAVFPSVRKDGIALFAAEDVAASPTPVQALTAVYLGGVAAVSRDGADGRPGGVGSSRGCSPDGRRPPTWSTR